MARHNKEQKMPPTPIQLHLYCAVIDHFGDAGVSWRVARELGPDPELEVTLIIDDLVPLATLVPEINSDLSDQKIGPIRVLSWDAATKHPPPQGDVILEMFGAFSEKKMLPVERKDALTINIEYLSAEKWTLDFHLKPSLKNDGKKYFYFLGWEENSGGLFYERDYFACRQTFHGDKERQREFRRRYGLPETKKKIILLFGYPSPIWARWAKIWREPEFDYQIWFAGKEVAASLNDTGLSGLDTVTLPFVPQTDFDDLLSLVDIAIIRGEDSFSRANLAGIPFLWQSYPQEEATRKKKVDAFLNILTPYLPPNLREAYLALFRELNGSALLDEKEEKAFWQALNTHLRDWKKAMERLQRDLLNQPSAFEKLTQLIKKQLK